METIPDEIGDDSMLIFIVEITVRTFDEKYHKAFCVSRIFLDGGPYSLVDESSSILRSFQAMDGENWPPTWMKASESSNDLKAATASLENKMRSFSPQLRIPAELSNPKNLYDMPKRQSD